MDELDFALDAKAIDDEGYIEGLAVGYGNLDYGGDIVLPGAITKSIASGKPIPMLMYHDQKRPAGVWTEFKEVSDGLLAKGRFSMSTRHGKEAHGLVKDGAIGGLSMGYRTLRHQIVGKARHIIEAALHEVSLVTIPMNEKTVVLSVKDLLSAGDLPSLPKFEEFLREAGFSKTQATAIAGKGLAHLLRSESGSASDPVELARKLRAAFG